MRESGEPRTPRPRRAGFFRVHRAPISNLPDMPKHHSCPQCGADSKRTVKLPTGAYYKCHTHGEFLIRRS